jgi:2-polyprenyl-3-methyl-5-hydroxy-6-metoxy-1,4-benzoquinol methylase
VKVKLRARLAKAKRENARLRELIQTNRQTYVQELSKLRQQMSLYRRSGATETDAEEVSGEADWIAQEYTHTFATRSDIVFAALRDILADQDMRDRRILSFGCSQGYEALDLARWFPDARVLGCDIALAALSRAHELCEPRGIGVFKSTPDAVRAFGPYDVITAMNVFLKYPMAQGKPDISDIYAFESFERQLDVLVDSLQPRGLLVIYNASYLFEQTRHAGRFDPVPIESTNENGWSDKYDRSGVRLTCVVTMVNGQDVDIHELRKINWEAEKIERPEIYSRHDRLVGVLPGVEPDVRTIVWRRKD